VSLRERSGRPGGGQKGHKGETLRQIAEPDRIVKHEACACRHCGSSLSAAMAVGMERRQTFDLPQRRIEVTEHQGLVYACAICGGATRAAFPQGVSGPAQYGERIRAAAVYLNAQQLIPEDRTAAALADLFGAHSLSPASVAQWTQRRAQAFLPIAARIGARLAGGRIRCLDETGFRVAGRTQWLRPRAVAFCSSLMKAEAEPNRFPISFDEGRDGLAGSAVSPAWRAVLTAALAFRSMSRIASAQGSLSISTRAWSSRKICALQKA
jgi:transposase